MKRVLIFSAAAFAFAAAAVVGGTSALSAPDAAKFAGDTVHSHVLFKVKHLGTSWSWGRFNDFAVSADVAGEDLKSVAFTVKTGSVDTGVGKRDQHLKSPDFLNATQFPEVSFKSTEVKTAGVDGWDVTGDLSLHGVTKPITVRVGKVGAGKGMKGEELIGLEATFNVKRSDYGMTNMVGPVGDDVTLIVAVEAAKQ
jgi:polyisoprenoid-binding protein YceI